MSWLDRQSFLGADSEAVLAGLTVGIVGLGGGGSHVAQQLAHVGIGRFVLVDNDRISETNLNRLVGGTAQDVTAERLKVDIAERVIKAVNPDADVDRVAEQWQLAMDRLARCDVVFGCVDNVRGKEELDAFCRRLLIPYLDQGMDVHELENGFLIAGQVILSVNAGPCLRCIGVVTDDALEDEGRNYGAAGGKPQVVWPNGVLASTAVGLFLQMVTPWHEVTGIGACLEYDGNRHTMVPSDRFRRLAERPCPHRPPSDLGDPTFDVRQLSWLQPQTADGSHSLPRPEQWTALRRWVGSIRKRLRF